MHLSQKWFNSFISLPLLISISAQSGVWTAEAQRLFPIQQHTPTHTQSSGYTQSSGGVVHPHNQQFEMTPALMGALRSQALDAMYRKAGTNLIQPLLQPSVGVAAGLMTTLGNLPYTYIFGRRAAKNAIATSLADISAAQPVFGGSYSSNVAFFYTLVPALTLVLAFAVLGGSAYHLYRRESEEARNKQAYNRGYYEDLQQTMFEDKFKGLQHLTPLADT